MPFGKTIDPSNFSLALHCPNPRACLGGELSEESLPLLNTSSSRGVADGVSQVMCNLAAWLRRFVEVGIFFLSILKAEVSSLP